MVLLCKNHKISYQRGDYRGRKNAINKINKHWDIFKQDLIGMKIVKIPKSSNKIGDNEIGYEIYLFWETFLTDSQGKVIDLFQNKREPKCDSPEIIEKYLELIKQQIQDYESKNMPKIDSFDDFEDDFIDDFQGGWIVNDISEANY